MPQTTAAKSVSKVLYSSEMLRAEIRRVLAEPRPGDRRVALVAFVGGQAEAFLPDPEGLQIVCALQPGSTDGVTLGRLKNRKAQLFKSDRLHMKVYWSSRNGCVICSANASGNALGGGNQREAGAWFPPGVVDIERLWQYANPKPLESSDLKKVTDVKRGGIRRADSSDSEARVPDFLEWLSLPFSRQWKLGWWNDGHVQLSRAAREKALKSYGVKEPKEFLMVQKKDTAPGTWFLTFNLTSLRSIRWMYTDFAVEVNKTDKNAYLADYPFQVVQSLSLERCPAPPFKIDREFKKAFTKAIEIYGTDKIERRLSLAPPIKVVQLVKTNWPTAGS